MLEFLDKGICLNSFNLTPESYNFRKKNEQLFPLEMLCAHADGAANISQLTPVEERHLFSIAYHTQHNSTLREHLATLTADATEPNA